jgi:hypothetical protein
MRRPHFLRVLIDLISIITYLQHWYRFILLVGASLSVVHWDGVPHSAIRWNVAFAQRAASTKACGEATCHGSPARNRLPTWFILPRELFHPDLFSSEGDQYKILIGQVRTFVMCSKRRCVD